MFSHHRFDAHPTTTGKSFSREHSVTVEPPNPGLDDSNSEEYKCSEISSDVSPGINDKFYVMATTRKLKQPRTMADRMELNESPPSPLPNAPVAWESTQPLNRLPFSETQMARKSLDRK